MDSLNVRLLKLNFDVQIQPKLNAWGIEKRSVCTDHLNVENLIFVIWIVRVVLIHTCDRAAKKIIP